MDKYLSNLFCTDFILADAGYFQTGGDSFHTGMALPQEVIDEVTAQGGVAEGGRVYGRTTGVQEFVTEERYRSIYGRWTTPEYLDEMVAMEERNEDGLLPETAQLYGMEPFALDQLKVLEGDISGLYEPGSRKIAAVYLEDDYGNSHWDSNWARVGDVLTLRYVEEFEYYNPLTGEAYESPEMIPSDKPYRERAVKYQDVEYEVAALVRRRKTIACKKSRSYVVKRSCGPLVI